MIKKIIKITCALTALLFVFSCRQNDQIADEYRSNLNLESELAQKATFKGLTTENKIRIWKSKILQIQNEDLTFSQRQLVKKIGSEIEKLADKNYDGIQLFEYAVQLSEITPDDEFIRMFAVIGDYKRNENVYKNNKSNSGKITSDLKSYVEKIKLGNAEFYSQTNNGSGLDKRPTCNCKWTCGFYTLVTNDNCDRSNGGCGFLWIQDCTGYV